MPKVVLANGNRRIGIFSSLIHKDHKEAYSKEMIEEHSDSGENSMEKMERTNRTT